MKKTNFVLLFFSLFIYISSIQSQNLLDMSNWAIGSGPAYPFFMYGSFNENERVSDINNIAESVISWKATSNGAAIGPSGGWNTSPISIDNTKTYQMSVWIKKTVANDGRTFFGPQSANFGTYYIRNLSGSSSINNDPFFLEGGIPELDRWYLAIAYVHNKNYSSPYSPSALYDAVTGARIAGLKGYKFSSNATNLQHRVHLYVGSTGTQDVQYMFDPRINVVDGTEPSLEELLNVNPNSSLIFAYDNIKSQKQRFYCIDDQCIIPDPPDGIIGNDDPTNTKNAVTIRQSENPSFTDIESLPENFQDIPNNSLISIFPNPAADYVTMSINESPNLTMTRSVKVYSNNGSQVKFIPLKSNTSTIRIDIRDLSNGIYFFHSHLSDGTPTTKQLIKN